MKSAHSGFVFLATLALVSAAALGAAPAAAESWNVDSSHTEVNFSVNHFFTPVNGTFDEFDIDLAYDAGNPTASRVRVTIPVGSINTRNERRDGHLLSADFFGADDHGEITFESTSVKAADDGSLIATGPLTIKGISREVELPITLLGIKDIPAEMQEMLGGAKRIASFKASTTLDRGDYEVGTGSWAADVVVGSDVDVEILVEAHLR